MSDDEATANNESRPAVGAPVEPTVRPRAWADDKVMAGQVGNCASDAAKTYWQKSNQFDRMMAERLSYPLYDSGALTAEHAQIEARCRKAFLLEDGYGVPSEHPERYRVFRDGFFAAWMRARADLGA